MLPTVNFLAMRYHLVSWGFSARVLIFSSGLLAAVVIGADWARLRSKRVSRFIDTMSSGIMREAERERLSAAAWYMMALVINHFLYTPIIGYLGFLFLLFGTVLRLFLNENSRNQTDVSKGDSAAAIVRALTPSKFSRITLAAFGSPLNKTLESSIVMFLMCYTLAFLVSWSEAGFWYAAVHLI